MWGAKGESLAGAANAASSSSAGLAVGLIPAQEVAGTRRAGVPCSLPAVPTCLSSDSGVAGESSLGNGCARGRTWNLCSSMEELLDLYSLQWYNEKKTS